MMNIRKFVSPIACVALVAAFSISVFAQNRATLRGSISDEFGATIVGATVTLTDANGAQKVATTNADGSYSFTNLAPGKYKIHAIAVGFAILLGGCEFVQQRNKLAGEREARAVLHALESRVARVHSLRESGRPPRGPHQLRDLRLPPRRGRLQPQEHDDPRGHALGRRPL